MLLNLIMKEKRIHHGTLVSENIFKDALEYNHKQKRISKVYVQILKKLWIKEYVNSTHLQITIQRMTLQNIEKLSFVENNASNCLVTNRNSRQASSVIDRLYTTNPCSCIERLEKYTTNPCSCIKRLEKYTTSPCSCIKQWEKDTTNLSPCIKRFYKGMTMYFSGQINQSLLNYHVLKNSCSKQISNTSGK